MILKYIFLALCLHFTFVCCDKSENTTAAEIEKFSTISARKTRATYDFVYADLIGCAVQSDPSCIVNVAEDFLSVKKNELLAQADQEVVKATGRSDPNNSPTELSKTIEKLLSDLTGLFKNGITRFFRDSDDDENEVSQEENKTDKPDEGKDNESRDVGAQTTRVARKKKYGPIHMLVHKIMFFVVIIFLLKYVLKFYYAGLATKHLLISKGYFLLYAIKLYYAIKHKKHEPAVYYEHSHHDYHSPPHEHHLPEHVLDYGEHDKDYSTHVTYDHKPYWGGEDHAEYGIQRRKYTR